MGRRDGVRPCRRDCLRLVVCATRAASLSIVHFRRLLDTGGPVNGAAASCDGPSPIEPVMNGSFPVCRLSTGTAGHDAGGPGRGAAAGAIGTSRDRAGEDGGKPSFLRLSIVHFS